MTFIRTFWAAFAPLTLLFSATALANADAFFDFQNITAGTVAPFTSTVNGLTASFSGQASVCDVTAVGFATLSGNALIQNFCNPSQTGPVNISFSSDLSGVTFNFATAFGSSGTLMLQAFEGATLVGTSVFNSSVPPGNFPNGEGFAFFPGTFNSLLLTPSSMLAVDNINATSEVPEPASFAMLAAGNIVLLVSAYRASKGWSAKESM